MSGCVKIRRGLSGYVEVCRGLLSGVCRGLTGYVGMCRDLSCFEING